MIEYNGPFLQLVMGLLVMVVVVLYGVRILMMIVAHQRKGWKQKDRTQRSEVLVK